MIYFVKGDLFADKSLHGLAHGCNCVGAMGAGIAVEFRERYPVMYETYHQLCKDGTFSLGSVMAYEYEDLIIFNLATQQTFGDASLDAIRQSVSQMIEYSSPRNIKRIGMPRIGAGLGGLDWSDVKDLLIELGDNTDVELVVFEDYVKGLVPKYE